MNISVDVLRKDTIALIKRIDMQIIAVEARAKEMGIDPHLMQDTQGYWPMIPLLAAKAQAYNTLVLLQTNPPRGMGPRSGGPPPAPGVSMPQTATRYARQMARMFPIEEFERAKIVIKLDWYGGVYCFHIDPGDGSTIPIYIDAHHRDRLAEAVNAIQSGIVDIQVAEMSWSHNERSGTKRWLVTIKESNAR